MSDSHRPSDSWRPEVDYQDRFRNEMGSCRLGPISEDLYRPRAEYEPTSRERSSNMTRDEQTSLLKPQAPNQTLPQMNTKQSRTSPKNAPTLSLNPTITPFQPAAQADRTQFAPKSHFTPYQPLRISNGIRESQVAKNNIPSHEPLIQQVQPSNRYPRRRRPQTGAFVQSRQYSSHEPIPSIEPASINPTHLRPGHEVVRRFSPRKSTPRRTVSPPPAPEATELYLTQARQPPVTRAVPQKLLIVLDLNGTLIDRPRQMDPKFFQVRPGLENLLNYLFENHVVMIYTSSQPKNAQTIVKRLLDTQQCSKLAAIWARDMLDLSLKQYSQKVQVYKKLDKIWRDKDIQATYPDGPGQWNQMNTVLIDDSHLKALAQPHNLLQIPEFKALESKKKDVQKRHSAREKQILDSLILKLEELKYQSDVSRTIFRWQTGKMEPPKLACGIGNAIEENKEPQQLPTPKSTGETNNAESEDSQDDEIQLDLGRQMEAMRTEDTRTKIVSVSPIPDQVWQELLGGFDSDPSVRKT